MEFNKNFFILFDNDKHKIISNDFIESININIIDFLIDNIQSKFFAILDIFKDIFFREFEADYRPIITLFLSMIIIQIRSQFGMSRFVIHSEFSISLIRIPEIELIDGKLDFMIANIIEYRSMNKHFFI